MDKRNLTIIGSYDTRAEALTAIDQLRNEGDTTLFCLRMQRSSSSLA